MEQEIGAQLLFTPHLAPMNRGILATCYARPAAESTSRPTGLLELLRDAVARRAVHGRHRRLAVDEGDARVERRARDGPLRRPHQTP